VLTSRQGYPYGVSAPDSFGKKGGVGNVVRWSGIGCPSSAEAHSNALLIAAAPDMLAALQKLDKVQAFSTPLPDYGAVSDLQDAFNAARAVIAKATGAA